MVAHLIARMDRWLAVHRPDYYATLNSGVTDEDLAALERRFSVKLPNSFRSLYKWRNGSDSYDGFVDHHSPMLAHLEDIVSTKQMLDSMFGDELQETKWWSRNWVPFLDYGNGDWHYIDLVGENGGIPGQIGYFCHDGAYERTILFPNLDAWLETAVASMEDGTLARRLAEQEAEEEQATKEHELERAISWQEWAKRGEKIKAIAFYQEETCVGLAEAKSAVEKWLSENCG